MALYRKLEKSAEEFNRWPFDGDIDYHMEGAGFTPMNSVVFDVQELAEKGIYFKKMYYRGSKKARVYILSYDCNGWSLRVDLKVK